MEETEAQIQAGSQGEGAVLVFQPIEVKLDLGVGKSPHGPMTDMALAYSLKLPPREHLALSTGEDVREMPLTLRITTGRALRDPDCTGAAYYSQSWEAEGFSDPARIHFDVDIPGDRFRLLLALARAARHPRRISLQILGMKYGAASDGSLREWDTADPGKQKLLISYIDISFSLTAAEAQASEPAMDRERTSREMLGVLQRQAKDIRVALAAIVGILIAILVLLFWRML